MSTLYLGARKGTVAPSVIFSGDPWRVEVLKRYLDDPVHVAFAREFNTYTGTYHGVPMTVSSTGIGAPSAAIAVEEMYEAGMRVAVRMGTSMSLRDDMLGQFIVPIAVMRRDGTSDTYVERGYPAVADVDLVNAMNQVVSDHGRRCLNGVTCSMDGFYTQMHDSRLSREQGRDISPTFDEMRRLSVCAIDMESSCILTVSRLMGVRACVVTLATVLENLRDSLKGDERTDAEDLLCRVILEGLARFAGSNG